MYINSEHPHHFVMRSYATHASIALLMGKNLGVIYIIINNLYHYVRMIDNNYDGNTNDTVTVAEVSLRILGVAEPQPGPGFVLALYIVAVLASLHVASLVKCTCNLYVL